MLFLDNLPHKGSASDHYHLSRRLHVPACAEARRIFQRGNPCRNSNAYSAGGLGSSAEKEADRLGDDDCYTSGKTIGCNPPPDRLFSRSICCNGIWAPMQWDPGTLTPFVIVFKIDPFGAPWQSCGNNSVLAVPNGSFYRQSR